MFADSFLPQKNGVVTLLCDLTRELVKREIEVTLFVPGSQNTTEEYCGAKVHRLRGYNFPFYPGYRLTAMSLRRLRRILDERPVDLYHVHDPFSLGAAGVYQGRRRQRPVVGTYNTHFVEYLPHFGAGTLRKHLGPLFGSGASLISKRVAWRLLRTFYRRCHLVTTPTHEMAKQLRRKGFRRVAVVPNGISIPEDRVVESRRREVRESLVSGSARNEKECVFLYLGRVSLEKRVDVLLKAFSILSKGNASLVIGGSGPQLTEYRRLASSLGIEKVRFTGTVPDQLLRALYWASDVFASASDTETFGITFLEAMSCGLPVLGASRGGPVELIEDGSNGFLFAPNSPEDLAAKMSVLAGDPELRERMGRESLQTASRYEIGRVADDFLRLYRELS
jgi:glycosyltransferase involved in cell wall biosynthesis